VLGETIMADLRAAVDSRRGTGLRYWVRVFGRAAITPATHCIVMYRISAALYRNPLTRPFAFLLRGMSVVWGGAEIHPAAKIGPGLLLNHSQMVVIGEGVTIGRNVRISHGVSIGGDVGRGASEAAAGWPVIGDGVSIGLHAIVMGPLTVGDHAVISAQALVVRDVAPHTLVAGSPARIVKKLDESLPKIGESDPDAQRT
jgi:serine O-acetyltransferase